MYVTAVVVAAGEGSRLNSKISKPLVEVGSKPILIYSLETLSKHPLVKDIVAVVNPSNRKGVEKKIKQYKIKKIKALVLGGIRRQDSVYNGLKRIYPGTDLLLIHDAARPFINKKIISALITQADISGAAIPGLPVKDTIKKVARAQEHKGTRNCYLVEKTIDREKLWEVQTPQAFKKDLILKAYEKFAKIKVTDDAMLVEKTGAKVSVVLGSYRNIKITTPEDLVLAEAILKTSNK